MKVCAFSEESSVLSFSSNGPNAWGWQRLLPSPLRNLLGLLFLESKSSILDDPTGSPPAPSEQHSQSLFPSGAMNVPLMKKEYAMMIFRHGRDGDRGNVSPLCEFGDQAFLYSCHYKGLQCTICSITVPQESNRPSLLGHNFSENGKEFLHYSEKLSPEIDKFPAGQDTASCL